MPSYQVDKKVLQAPDNLIMPKELSHEPYDRLSVAYGLSFDAYDLGKIRQAQEVEDDVAPEEIKSNYEDNYIGPECL